MTTIRGDASEVYALATGLEAAGLKALPTLRGVIQVGAAAVKTAWQANARATAGAHGIHYPSSIRYETRLLSTSAVADIGPDAGMPQGGMSFEYGSRNQPPHLDGLKALEASEATVVAALTAATSDLLP